MCSQPLRKTNLIKISLILCMFGFLKEFRPGEPFITDYLTGYKNFTEQEIKEDIYPIGTYSSFATLILVFLLTDFLRYKPIIVLCGISGIVTYCFLTFGQTLTTMVIVEILYGLYISTDIAYYTYIYAKVDKKDYPKVSGYMRSAILLGRFMAGTLSQLVVSFKLLNYHELNFLTIAGQTLATIWAIFLPSVRQSVYFHPKSDSQDIEINRNCEISSSQQNIVFNKIDFEPTITTIKNNSIDEKKGFMQKVYGAYCLLWKDFLKAFTNKHVLKWSLWWAAATCGYLQVVSYIQLAWQTSVEKDEVIYNGAVEAMYSIIGAATVFSIGLLKLNWSLVGEIVLSIFTFIEALLLLVISQSYHIWLQYILYIIFGVIYHTIVTVASFEVSQNISEDSYGLVFGINTTLALAMQSLLTFIVTSKRVLRLAIRPQFVVYSGYFAVLATIFTVMALITITKKWQSGEELKLWTKRNEKDKAIPS